LPTLEQQEIALLKGRVSQLEARLEFLYRHLGVTFVAQTRPGDDSRVIEALKANNMLEPSRPTAWPRMPALKK